MATSEITPVVENRKERASSESPNQQETRMENSHTSDVHKSSAKWPAIMKQLVDPNVPFIKKWNVIFLVSCVFAVFVDPLFLYIPIIINEQDIKCLRSDNKLKIAALVLRSVTDLCFLLNIFFQVYSISTTNSSALRRRIRYILIDILAVLPIPQIIILIFYFKTRGSRSFGTSKLMNFFVLVQYVPRVFRIYLSYKEFEKYYREEFPIWLKVLLSFTLYFLASHVLGAFWYFFAIQRITTCWQYGCRNENGCDPNNLDCHDHYALRNITFLNDVCSIHPPNNEMFFDFGIYLDILQLGILGSTNYPEKFSNCFWWGLRNLSSLGSNLKPSINTWENLFAVFISIIGFLLYIIYLTGNLQIYMQLEAARMEAQRRRMRIEKKMEEKGREVEQWLSKNGIPSSEKLEIMKQVEVELKKDKDKDVDVENILTILPFERRRDLKICMPLNRLKQVPLLQNTDEKVLMEISEYLKPEKYTKNEIIIRENEPLLMMIFIVERLVIVEMSDCSQTLQLSAGKVYGEKLLTWPAWTSFPSVLPVATESLRADGDVEALVLTASDIEDVVLKLKLRFFNEEEITRRTDDEWELLESDRVTMLRKVPKLETMDTRVLKDISEHLKPMSCEGFIITEGKPLRMMVFVTSGSISLKKDGDLTNEKRHQGEFYGEELLDWVLDTSFPAIVPISTHDVGVDNATVLILTAKDLGRVVSNFKSYFSKEITSPTNSSSDLCAIVGLTWLKRGTSIFQHMDEEVLKVISKHLKLMSYSVDTYIVRENNPLEYMFIFVEGSSMSIETTLRPFKRKLLGIGDFYGEELVYWVTNWTASQTTFPDKLPLSTSEVKVGIDDTGNAGVLVLSADDLKSIVSQFRSRFIKQTALPVNSEGNLPTFDAWASLRKVPQLRDKDQKTLEEIHRSLIPMKFNNTPLYPKDEIKYPVRAVLDKIVLIVSGVVSSVTIESGKKVYHYLGDHRGDNLFKWALRPDSSFYRVNNWIEAVGEVEALILRADDLIRLDSELKLLKENR